MQRSIRRVSIIVILAMTSLSLVILPAQATTTWSLAVAGDGAVYATSGGYLYALNAETGSQIWVAPADSPFVLPEYPLGALLAIAVPLLVVVCCRAGLKGKQRF